MEVHRVVQPTTALGESDEVIATDSPAPTESRRLMGALAVVVFLLVTLPATAPAQSIAIEDFDVAVDVDHGGSLAVTETIRLRFDGRWNGIHRLIPVEYRSPQGYAYYLSLRHGDVIDVDSGKPLKVHRSREHHYADLKIFIPEAVDASRTIRIHYTVRRGLRFFDDHDELYWNVTGDEWPYPIREARVRVTLPSETVNVRANAFTGGYGSNERAATIRIDGVRHEPSYAFEPAGESPPPADGQHVVEVESERPLGIREGLTVAVAWNPGVIHRPGPLENALAWAWDNLGWIVLNGGLAILPLATFALMLRQWIMTGRDPYVGPVAVRYEPPTGLGPAEVGTLLDNSPDSRDLMAMLVDLAVKGHLRIRETAEAGWFTQAKYAFDLLLPEDRWGALPKVEERFLNAMFSGRSNPLSGTTTPDGRPVLLTVTSDDLEHSFFRKLPRIRNTILDGLVSQGHYTKRPDHVVAGHLGLAIGVAVLLVVVTTIACVFLPRATGGSTILLAIVSGFATSLCIAGFGLVMPARTRKGSEARAAIRGFEEYLSRVESHKLQSTPLSPELFERYLPFAMALGVEGRWAKAFDGICTEPPQWFAGAGPVGRFHTADLTGGLSRMGAVTTAAMQSGPRSSGGSGFGGSGLSGFSGGGFSGGGFSGGGFGGGGGRGF